MHRDLFEEWQLKSNYLCCLEASHFKIDRIRSELDAMGVKYITFKEPDFRDELTAICIQPLDRLTHKKLFKNLKLTLS